MELNRGRIFMGRFKRGEDLLGAVTGFCGEKGVKLGEFLVIGAVTNAKMGYYDQDKKKYTECLELNKKLEITSCIGNISLRDSEVFAHGHITLADLDGKCYGGHLMPGTIIYAAEYSIKEFNGGELSRKNDPETGLCLW